MPQSNNNLEQKALKLVFITVTAFKKLRLFRVNVR